MNKRSLHWLTLLAVTLVQAEDHTQVRLTFKAQTDFGEPVAGVAVSATTFVRWEPGEASGRDVYDGPTGTTNAAGLVTLSIPLSRGEVRYSGHLDGFYPNEGSTSEFKRGSGGEWLPASATVDIVMKPILNPVPVFARRPENLRLPIQKVPVGFDLMKSDWVAPYGAGAVADFIFVFESDFKGTDSGFNATLLLEFSNAGDGIQSVLVPPKGGSKLRLPRFAPENGYLSQLLFERTKAGPREAIRSEERESQNYFFRVRTQKIQGKIISALYGKISGNIEFWEDGEIRFAYYLNPEPLSRNMEFDMNRNHFRGLRGYEALRKP